MADITLEEFQNGQSRRISKQVIGSCEEHEQKMQTSWQKQWEAAHSELVAILRFLDQDYDEACAKSAHPLEKFADGDIAYLIQVRIRALKADLANQVKTDEVVLLRNQLVSINQKHQEITLAISSKHADNQRLAEENSNLKAHLAALRQAQREGIGSQTPTDHSVAVPHIHTSDGELPDWMIAWRSSKTFDRTSLAILVMGETGKALRPSIIKIMAKKLSLSADNNSLDEAIYRLIASHAQKSYEDQIQNDQNEVGNEQPPAEETLGLIETVEGLSSQGSSAGGNLPDVFRLSARGRLAYQTLTGHQPKENEYDHLVRSHSSPEHTILNIQAVEMLEEEGYRIQAQVQEIRLSNGGTFIPDITAVNLRTGEIIFVEVERDVHKDQSTRKLKWMNLYEASNGNLYVFCDNLNCQRLIQGEINLALGGLTFNSFLTNLHGLRNGKRSENDGSIWLSMKRGK